LRASSVAIGREINDPQGNPPLGVIAVLGGIWIAASEPRKAEA
jgi:hypothetical protein